MKSSSLVTWAAIIFVVAILFGFINVALPDASGVMLMFIIGFVVLAFFLGLASILEHIEQMHDLMKQDYLKRYPEEAPKENATVNKQ